MPSFQTFIYIADSSGAVWQIGVDDSGTIQAPVASGQPGQTIIVNPILSYPFMYREAAEESYLALVPVPPNSFEYIVAAGALTTAPVSFSLMNQADQLMRSPGGTYWRVKCDASGKLKVFLDWQSNPDLSRFGQSIGQLDLDDWVERNPLRPVQYTADAPTDDPKPLPTELTGLFQCGDGFSIVGWEIKQASLNGEPVFLVKSPYTGYVQNIYTPAQLEAIYRSGAIVSG